MHYLPEFFTVLVIHILGAMLPGPDFAMVTRSSLIYSRRNAVFTALGVAIGTITHVSYALLGIAYIVEHSIVVYSVIKFMGAGYLVYLGVKVLLQSKNINDQSRAVAEPAAPTTKDIPARVALRGGFLCNALNPKCGLFFLSIFTQVISPSTPALVQLFYGITMVVTTFMWFGFVALVFSHGKIKNYIAPLQKKLEKFFGVILIALGVKVAVSK